MDEALEILRDLLDRASRQADLPHRSGQHEGNNQTDDEHGDGSRPREHRWPASHRYRSHLPCSVGHEYREDRRIGGEDAGVAHEHVALRPEGVTTPHRVFEAACCRNVESRLRGDLVEVDHDRGEAPELVTPAFRGQIEGIAPDEAPATLEQIEGSGEDELPLVDGALHRRRPLGVSEEIVPDRRLVAGERPDIGDHGTGCELQAAQSRIDARETRVAPVAAGQTLRELLEVRRHVAPAGQGERADAVHERETVRQRCLEMGPGLADVRQRLRPHPLRVLRMLGARQRQRAEQNDEPGEHGAHGQAQRGGGFGPVCIHVVAPWIDLTAAGDAGRLNHTCDGPSAGAWAPTRPPAASTSAAKIDKPSPAPGPSPVRSTW